MNLNIVSRLNFKACSKVDSKFMVWSKLDHVNLYRFENCSDGDIDGKNFNEERSLEHKYDIGICSHKLMSTIHGYSK